MIVSLTLVGCDRCYSDFTFFNRGALNVENITIFTGDGSQSVSTLAPNESKKIKVHLNGEGGAAVTYSVSGHPYRLGSCYYTGGMPSSNEITFNGLNADLKCT